MADERQNGSNRSPAKARQFTITMAALGILIELSTCRGETARELYFMRYFG
jgi:hypothetical protein